VTSSDLEQTGKYSNGAPLRPHSALSASRDTTRAAARPGLPMSLFLNFANLSFVSLVMTEHLFLRKVRRHGMKYLRAGRNAQSACFFA
jgi:hypothetical protein